MLDIWSSVAGVFALIAVTLSFYEIIVHLCNYTKPYLQRYTIRILLMVPIYSLNAWVAMILPAAGLYLDSSREVYESFVIYSFMKYLLNFLYYDTNLQQYIDHKPGPSHIFPFCLLPTCPGGRTFMLRCKHGILQYVVIRPITTLIAFTSQLFSFYGEGNYNPFSGYTFPVLLIINNLSQFTAMYCLVIFYTGYRHELQPMQPLAKFFSIKLVVFFSFFQSVAISGLMEIDWVEKTLRGMFPGLEDKVALGRKVQEFLICIDMLIAAVGHLFAFSHKSFREDEESNIDGGGGSGNSTTSPYASQREPLVRARHSRPQQAVKGRSCCDALCNILDFSDEKSDVSEHFGQIFDRIRNIYTRRQPLPLIVSSATNHLTDDWMAYDEDTGQQNLIANAVNSGISGGGGSTARAQAASGGRQQVSATTNYQSID